MSDELIDICDEDNNIIGQEFKEVAHDVGSWHRTVHIWFYNAQSEVLLQLRAPNKKLHPNTWDTSVAGHIGS